LINRIAASAKGNATRPLYPERRTLKKKERGEPEEGGRNYKEGKKNDGGRP